MKTILSFIVIFLLLVSIASKAESDIATGQGTLSSSASLYFVIKIPQTLFMRVGPDSNLIQKNRPAGSVANGRLATQVTGNSGAVLSSVNSKAAVGNENAKNIQINPNVLHANENQASMPIIYTATMP
ncbi:MAG TPA: hypothetical protein PK342_11005 [Methylotenera sp.]|nr:hypothetical protein [Methylotenera sp.]